MVRLGGLWNNITIEGTPYFSGDFGPYAKLIIFPNKHKTEDKHPDYIVYVDDKEKR